LHDNQPLFFVKNPMCTPSSTRNDLFLPAVKTQLYATAADVAEALAQIILNTASQVLQRQPHFRILLAGGQTPLLAYHKLGALSAQNWQGWECYLGDERGLPAGHPERNSVMIEQAWLRAAAFPDHAFFPIPVELGITQAAQQYGTIIQQRGPFDLVILGMGEDGHTASLFPNRVIPDDQWAIAVEQSPKPPPERVSVTLTALAKSGLIVVPITGQNKQAALAAWRAGAQLPIVQAVQMAQAIVLLDHAAAQAIIP
jgi:6-phosphogluconolactonase